MEEKIIVYVAGNPDAYPLEYYDQESGTFCGLIPQLLQGFSEHSDYSVEYYAADGKDHRSHFEKNMQVDLLSGYAAGENGPEHLQKTLLFSAVRDGNPLPCSIYYTDAAPLGLKQEMDRYFSSVEEEEITGMLLEVQQPQVTEGSDALSGAALSAVVVLLFFIVLMQRKHRKTLKQAEQTMEIDEITGLGNLDYLARYYDQYVTDRTRVLYQMIYFYVDTDRLRRVMGSTETEDFLKYCAVVLQENTAKTDILARSGESGFVLVRFFAEAQKTEEWLDPVFRRIDDYAARYGRPFANVTAAGICNLEPSDRNPDELIFRTHQGACAALRDEQRYIFCDRQLMKSIEEEQQLLRDFEHALQQGEFLLYLQFYVKATDHTIVGAEALSRWKHPEKGILNPGAFIPLMEREKQISRLDYAILEKVCEFLERLLEKGEDHFFISCNFSRSSFGAPDFADRCIEIMNARNFPKELLIFEITESAENRDIEQIQENIRRLREYGVRIALDDFGDGFTSFDDLQKYRIDGLKLDKRLIDGILTDRGATIVRAMVQVGHELGITILAEGVELEKQAEVLQAMHCDVIQGFLFWHPLPESEAERILMNGM